MLKRRRKVIQILDQQPHLGTQRHGTSVRHGGVDLHQHLHRIRWLQTEILGLRHQHVQRGDGASGFTQPGFRFAVFVGKRVRVEMRCQSPPALPNEKETQVLQVVMPTGVVASARTA